VAWRENEFQKWNRHDNLVETKMTFSFSVVPGIAILLGLVLAPDAFAQDTPIDKLLNKLPPPENVLKPQVQRTLPPQDPAFRDPLGQQTVSAISKQDFRRAMNLSRKLTERYPNSAPAYCLRGSLACSLRQYGEATSAFHTAIGIQPRSADAHFGLGLVEGTQGHFAAALPHLQRSAELEPDSFIPYVFLSDFASSLGRKKESRRYAKKATELGPSFVFTWLQLARAEKELGHTEATLDAVSKAAEIAPDSAVMLALVGYSYISANRLAQAIPPLQRAARLAPRDYLLQSQLGYCLAATGQVDAGISYLRKGASLAPNYGPVWENLGLAYQKKSNHRDAVKAFERATQLLPNHRLPWQHLSEEYRAMGRMQDAERAAARAQSLPAGNSKPGSKKA
jgi:tetratricopeptide (TPR) repeat protein